MSPEPKMSTYEQIMCSIVSLTSKSKGGGKAACHPEALRAAVVVCGDLSRILKNPLRVTHLGMAELSTDPGACVSQR